MKNNNDHTNAFLIHISAFAGYIFPFGSVIVPLILWQSLKDRSQYLDEQGKEAVNFNLSYGLYALILGATMVPFFIARIFRDFPNIHDLDFNLGFGDVFGIFGFASLAGLFSIIYVALIILAAVKANKGEGYKYPLTIKFIK